MANNIWFLPKKPDVTRILFHAANHIGLGHINRSIAVAQWLLKGIPNLQVLFLIEGGEDLINPTGFPWIFIYSQKTEIEQTQQITQTALSVFRPDLMIHDTVLRPAVYNSVSQAGVKQVLVGRVGDILRDHFQHRLSILNGIDLLLLPHQKEDVAPADQAMIAQYRGKAVYTGPLVRRKDRLSETTLRQQLGLKSADKVILLTLGGGGYDLAVELLANLLAAKGQILASYPQTKLIVISGPHFNGELPQADEFVCYASRFEPFFSDYLNIASVVVCLAGYNTVNEVAASGIPAICVPTAQADDQVGKGGMGEYAQRFPHIALGSVDIKELTDLVIDAMGRQRDFSTVEAFVRQAEAAAQSLIHEIKCLLDEWA
jgi:spore coat polysaccharide biosynthesis predicted glycosyltransferase SpsG